MSDAASADSAVIGQFLRELCDSSAVKRPVILLARRYRTMIGRHGRKYHDIMQLRLTGNSRSSGCVFRSRPKCSVIWFSRPVEPQVKRRKRLLVTRLVVICNSTFLITANELFVLYVVLVRACFQAKVNVGLNYCDRYS